SSRPKSKPAVACIRGVPLPLKKLKLNIGYAPYGSSNLTVILAADLAQIVACRRRSSGSANQRIVDYRELALSLPLCSECITLAPGPWHSGAKLIRSDANRQQSDSNRWAKLQRNLPAGPATCSARRPCAAPPCG